MTKYERVENWIVQGMENGRLKPGDLLPSEADLCQLLSVGRNSVRTALNNLSHKGIIETKKGIGTFCLGPKLSATMDVGFVTLYSQQYIFPEVAQGCNQVLTRNNYHLVLAESRRDPILEREVLNRLWKRKVDGIILQPSYDGKNPANVDFLREIERSGVPIVLIDNYYPEARFSAVVMNDREGGRLAAAHLWEHGHQRIGIIYHRTYYPKILRMQGAVEYLREKRCRVPDNWLIGFDRMGKLEEVRSRLSESFAREAKNGGQFPTAFVCTNDQEAIELIRVAAEHGLAFPRDLSIVSFDNSTLADLPGLALTSINHPSKHMGEMATDILLEKLKHRGVRGNTVTMIEPELIVRTSVVDIRPAAASYRSSTTAT